MLFVLAPATAGSFVPGSAARSCFSAAASFSLASAASSRLMRYLSPYNSWRFRQLGMGFLPVGGVRLPAPSPAAPQTCFA
jgi:hypothetical protein